MRAPARTATLEAQSVLEETSVTGRTISPPDVAVRLPASRRRPLGAWAFFAGIVLGWVLFVALIVGSEGTLGELHGALRDQALAVELLVWFLFFPFVLALTIWTTAWEEWLRFALVACCAVAWTVACYPGLFTRSRGTDGSA